jgi:hypothetical protein
MWKLQCLPKTWKGFKGATQIRESILHDFTALAHNWDRQLESCSGFDVGLPPRLSVLLDESIPVHMAEFLATDPEVPGSIPGPTTFSEK